MFEADEALRVLERPREANQLAVLDGEVESEGELGRALGCGADDRELVGGTDTGDDQVTMKMRMRMRMRRRRTARL